MRKAPKLPALKFFRLPFRIEEKLEGRVISRWIQYRSGQREWEDFYRRRWQYDKRARSTHGCNCTGSCSWLVYVKDGIVGWETQAVDYPGSLDLPDYEPRGCPRGASCSWYVYSPSRVKYPYIRSSLISLWREALAASGGDPVVAWQNVVEDPEKAARYKQARGLGGLVRTTWEEALTIISASLIYTIKKYGPDRIFGFTPIPAMSMVGYASGSRFLTLIGGSILSFYDWYSDLPPSSPQMWGEQTDVPVSADWFNSDYIVVWGTNVPQTRTPDAHFYAEARYRGARVVAVSPDYSEYVKFADTWLAVNPGMDSALAMAMTYVVLKEFYIDREVDFFANYAKQFTDLPFVVRLRKGPDEGYIPERFVRASDIGLDVNNAEWKPLLFDTKTRRFVVPNGTVGSRWGEEGKWNLRLENSLDGNEIAPALTFAHDNDGWALVAGPVFEVSGSTVRSGEVPIRRVVVEGEETFVATVFDLLVAHVGVKRHGVPGRAMETMTESASDSEYDEDRPYTPAWQEAITGVPRAEAIRVAREFAQNAEKTGGRSMILLGSGINHWFHSDQTYRSIVNLTNLCGCQGVNGGGWAHYTGQEKVRPLAGWSTLAFASDWLSRPRQQNATSFYYFANDVWRYESVKPDDLISPLYRQEARKHIADYNVVSARMGWLPFYPQFNRNPIDLCSEAEADSAKSDDEIVAYAIDKLKRGDMRFAVEDPDAPENVPRILLMWRANVLGASGKGQEYFLKHLLGAKNSLLQQEHVDERPEEIVAREPAPEGKLDLLVTFDFRMNMSTLYSDIILPAATWYEMDDLSTTDLHPFIHPFTPAVDPLWESKMNWQAFSALASTFSELAAKHLGTRKDLVAGPLLHDTPDEIAQPAAAAKDWRKGEVEPVPGKTMPNLTVVTRDYPNVSKMMTALGPVVEKQGLRAKGITWNAAEQYEQLKRRVGVVGANGVSAGMPALTNDRDAAEAILTLSPETNGRAAVQAWRSQEKKTGLALAHLSAPSEGVSFTFADIDAQPRKVLTSPTWSGIETESRPYSPFVINREQLVPFRTLTGRTHFYLDHEWMRYFGDSLPTFRHPLVLQSEARSAGITETSGKELVLRYLTPHSKWSIHTCFAENDLMTTLSRGGISIWISDEDARSLDVRDNDWLECYNVNGVVMARAVVSPRIPKGNTFLYHAQEGILNEPIASVTGGRGHGHNSVTRIYLQPTLMIGGYAQLSYGFNYYGTIGSQRDEVVIVRTAPAVVYER